MTGEQGEQPGQLAVSGDVWLVGLLELRCPGERGGAGPLHSCGSCRSLPWQFVGVGVRAPVRLLGLVLAAPQ